jgi:hypothetical protein
MAWFRSTAEGRMPYQPSPEVKRSGTAGLGDGRKTELRAEGPAQYFHDEPIFIGYGLEDKSNRRDWSCFVAVLQEPQYIDLERSPGGNGNLGQVGGKIDWQG